MLFAHSFWPHTPFPQAQNRKLTWAALPGSDPNRMARKGQGHCEYMQDGEGRHCPEMGNLLGCASHIPSLTHSALPAPHSRLYSCWSPCLVLPSPVHYLSSLLNFPRPPPPYFSNVNVFSPHLFPFLYIYCLSTVPSLFFFQLWANFGLF